MDDLEYGLLIGPFCAPNSSAPEKTGVGRAVKLFPSVNKERTKPISVHAVFHGGHGIRRDFPRIGPFFVNAQSPTHLYARDKLASVLRAVNLPLRGGAVNW